jgi:eukaryotic-like serine/threonine-protein kinase
VRFVQEAQILARLRHPNIVGVRGLGRFPSGGYFLVMDFINGVDLQARLQDGPLPLPEVVRIVKDVATAVQHAHDQGVVHCDLKPGNVLLDQHGHVFVTDFGFAYLVAANALQSIGGTAGYVAPEILSRGSSPTPAADIYALGMLMWMLSTGRLPVQGHHAQSSDQSLAKVHEICRRCIADAPSARYASACLLIEDLARLN